MTVNLSPSVAICAMSRTGQPQDNALSDYETILSINNTHVQNSFVVPDLIVAMDDLERDVETEPEYVKAITEHGCPVLSTRSFDQWPNVEPYPLDEVVSWLEQHVLGGRLPASKLLDNSINYAISLCLVRDVKRIGLFGVDLTAPYMPMDLADAMVRWGEKGYGHAPWWFAHYDKKVLAARFPQECGWESLHFLIGWGMGRGVEFGFMSDSTILNADRPDFLYGYQEQPEIK